MPSPFLNPTNMAALEAGVRNASREKIEESLFENKAILGSGEWLSKSNKYLLKTIQTIYDDSVARPPRIVSKYLKDYIAISSILHCKDAWDYYSNSISAMLEGNMSNAIHLAYYAELRATVSFLASEGIGIFNSKHYYVNGAGKCVKFAFTRDIGTHKFV